MSDQWIVTKFIDSRDQRIRARRPILTLRTLIWRHPLALIAFAVVVTVVLNWTGAV